MDLVYIWYDYNGIQWDSQFPELWSDSSCRSTTIDYRCDQWCVWPKMWWSNKHLDGSVLILKKISVPWFGRDYWHGGHAEKSNKTSNNAKYSSCKGLIHETYDVSLQNLRSLPFWILSHLEFYFYPSPSIYKLSMIRFVHKVHFDVDF